MRQGSGGGPTAVPRGQPVLLTREGMAGEGVTPGHEMPPTYRPGKEEVPTLLLGPSGGAAGDA